MNELTSYITIRTKDRKGTPWHSVVLVGVGIKSGKPFESSREVLAEVQRLTAAENFARLEADDRGIHLDAFKSEPVTEEKYDKELADEAAGIEAAMASHKGVK